MSTFTPTPVPWTLEGAINKIPEVYTGAVTSEAVKLYTELLLPLPKDAQLWITEMGFGLEDFVIDANEALLLALLVEKNVPTIMFILTSPNIIDGVSQSDVT